MIIAFLICLILAAWVSLLVVLARKVYIEKFLAKRYNKKVLEIIENAPNMSMSELIDAFVFLKEPSVKKLVKESLWSSASESIAIRREILY